MESLLAKDDVKGDRARLRFSAPADVKGTVLLTIEGKDGA